jgi:hypothetical protein
MGIGDWGLGIGDWANPHSNLNLVINQKKIFEYFEIQIKNCINKLIKDL